MLSRLPAHERGLSMRLLRFEPVDDALFLLHSANLYVAGTVACGILLLSLIGVSMLTGALWWLAAAVLLWVLWLPTSYALYRRFMYQVGALAHPRTGTYRAPSQPKLHSVGMSGEVAP